MELVSTSFNFKTEVCGANVSLSTRCTILVKKGPFNNSKIKRNITANYSAIYVSDSSVIITATIFLHVCVQDNCYTGYLY
jgi:hypothetical protein